VSAPHRIGFVMKVQMRVATCHDRPFEVQSIELIDPRLIVNAEVIVTHPVC
jgi:hypothetical protein